MKSLRLPPNFKLYKVSPNFIWEMRPADGEKWNNTVFTDHGEQVHEMPDDLANHALVYLTTDVDTGEPIEIVRILTAVGIEKIANGESMTNGDILYKNMMVALEHEVKEWFAIGGKPYSPAHI